MEMCWVSLRLSPDFHSRFERNFVLRLFVALCGWKAALLDPDQVIDSTTQECPVSFFFSFFFLPLETTCTCFHSVSGLYPSALWGAVPSVELLSAQPVGLQAPAASISSHTVPVRLTARRDPLLYGRWRATSVSHGLHFIFLHWKCNGKKWAHPWHSRESPSLYPH